ncbi:hypothetical protein BIV01_10345 [Curtobacterium sp. MCBA15_013]|nr:hypothetical protein BIV01_10345 [Curtobacterium sp. MCBA15_013]
MGLDVDPENLAGYQRVVDRLGAFDELGPAPGSWAAAVGLHHAMQERHPTEFVQALAGFRTLIIGAEGAANLPGILRDAVVGLRSSVLPDAAAYLVESTERLGRRYAVARAMLNVGERPPEPTSTGETFSSSLKLMEDINIGLGAYLEPLVTSLSPHVWATTAPRAGGVIVLVFGKAVPSRPLLDLDLLELSERSAHIAALDGVQDISPAAYRAAITWWVERLDLVFSQLTQPSNYVVDGQYHPPSAVERLLAFEQLCRSVQTIGSSRDGHARRLALFHTLDSLAGLNRTLTRDRATTLSKMEAVVADLERHLPSEVHPVLLPRAHAAVEALRDVQDGFFMKSRLRDAGVMLPDKNGIDVRVPLATAAREWLAALRNSQHGMDKTPTARTRALLAAHTGALDPRITDLAWLALLEVLAHPELLVRRSR